jgi:hypothetical protein
LLETERKSARTREQIHPYRSFKSLRETLQVFSPAVQASLNRTAIPSIHAIPNDSTAAASSSRAEHWNRTWLAKTSRESSGQSHTCSLYDDARNNRG